MGVLVRVDVRDHDAGGLQLANLRRGFGFNFVGIGCATHRAQCEAVEVLVKATVIKLSIRELGSLSAPSSGEPSTRTTWQPTVSFGFERARRTGIVEARRLAMRVVEVTMPLAMGFNDSAIHSLREPEIIRIDDQTPHATG